MSLAAKAAILHYFMQNNSHYVICGLLEGILRVTNSLNNNKLSFPAHFDHCSALQLHLAPQQFL